MNKGEIPQMKNDNIVSDDSQHKDKNREWSLKLSSEAITLVRKLGNKEATTVVDCGAGEGRHSIYALEQGVGKVIAIEKDAAQNAFLQSLADKNRNLEVKNGNTLEELENLADDSIDGIIDCGMSHYFKIQAERSKFAELVKRKLKKDGLYSITHFSENEIVAKDTYHAKLEELKTLFPDVYWDDTIMPWREESWESGGNKHFAYKAVLKKR